MARKGGPVYSLPFVSKLTIRHSRVEESPQVGHNARMRVARHTPRSQIHRVSLGLACALSCVASLCAQLVITSNTSNYSNSGYTGTIIIRGATLSLSTGNALGNSAIVDIESNGILNITSEGEKFGNITGEGTVILGTSTLDIMANSQDSRFTGALDGSGMFQISTDASEDDTFTLGTNKISTDYTSDAYSYTGMFNIADANLALETAAGDHGDRLINVFDGPGDIRKTGEGTLTFGDNSTTLSAMLSPHDGALEIADGILALDTSTGNYILTHDYLKGAGTLGIKGDGTHTLTLTGDWDAFGDFTGDVRVFANGRFIVGADDSLGDGNAVHVDAGGLLQLEAAEGFGSLSGFGEVKFGSNALLVGADGDSVTFSGELNGSADVTKNGGGTWTLGGTGSNGDTNTPEDVLDGFSGNLVISAGTVAFDTSAGDATVDTTITGAGGIEKAGANTLSFSGTNTYTGGTTLTGGTLSIDADADLGAASGDITFNGGTLASTNTLTLGSGRAVTVNENGGTLETASSTTLTLDGVISGSSSATLAKTGAGTLTINATNTFSGLYDVSDGTLKIGTGNTLDADATVNLDETGAILDLSAESEEFGILTGTGRVKLDDATIGLGHDSAGADFTFDGIIGETDDTGGLTKSGNGNLTLTGTSVYRGNTIIDGGTLTLSNDGGNTLRASSHVIINNGSELALEDSEDLGGELTLNSGSITGPGAFTSAVGFNVVSGTVSASLGGTGSVGLTKSGSGTVTLSAANTYTGDTTVTAGTLQLGANERIADTSDLVVNGGTFDLNDFNETLATVSGTGGTIDLGSGTLISTNPTAQTYNGNITGTGTFQKRGDGILTLGGENTLTGTIDIQAGTVALGPTDVNALGSSTNVNVGENTTFDISGQDEGFDTLTGSGNITLGTRDIFMNDGDFSGVISGSGEVNKNGTDTSTLTLLGNSTHTGETNINIGTLALRGGNLTSSTVDVKSGAVLDVIDQTAEVGAIKGAGGVRIGTGTVTAGGNDANTTFSGTIDGTSEAELIKTGTGTLTLTDNLGFTGDIIIDNGTLALGNGGSTGSGNPVLINAAGNLTFDNSSLTSLNASFLTGTGSVTKEGNYTLTLSGTNDHTGATFINDGTLTFGRASALNRQSAVTIADGATLDTSRSTDGALLGSLAGAGDWVISRDLFPYPNNNMQAPAPVTVGYDGTDTTFTGRVLAYDDPDYPYTRNAGEFTKVGNGILTLDTTDFGFETLNIQAGTLKLDVDDGSGGKNILDNDQIVVLSAGAVLDITADSEGFGGLAGTGGMVRMGSSDLTIGADNQFRIYSGGLNSFTLPDDSAPAAEPGDFIKNGTAFFRINGALASNLADFAGDYIINSGTLQFGTGNSDYSFEAGRLRGNGRLATSGSATSRLILQGDPLNFAGDFIVETSILEFEVTAENTVSIASDRFDGAGTLRKSGTGTLTMDGGDGGFTGDIEVAGGTFKSGGGGNSLSDSTSVDLESGTTFVLTGDEKFGGIADIDGITGTGGTFDLAGYEGNLGYDNATSALFSGSITSTGGGGNIIKGGTGKLTLGGTSSYTGGTEIIGGTLALGASNILPNSGNFHVNGGIFDLATFDDTVGPVTLTSGSITGSGTLTSSSYAVKSGIISSRIGGSSSLAKTTSGTVTLSGSNSGFSGGVTVSAGTLQTGNADALGTGAVTVSGGTLDLGGNTDTVGQVTLTSGTITNGTLSSSAGFDVRSGTVSGNFTGTGGLTKSTSGTVTLSGNNTYSGPTTVNDGTLRLGAVVAASSSSNLIVNSGAFDVNGFLNQVGSISGTGGTIDLGSGTLFTSTSANTAFSGNLTGSGTLQKLGSGTLTLAGENGLTGTIDIHGGTVALGSTDNNALGGSATVNVGASGTFDVSGQDEGFGTLTGSGTVDFGDNSSRFLAVSGGSFTGTFDGAGEFRHAGSGTYTLSTANLSTYSGELVSESGTLALDTGSGTHTLANAITGSGNLEKTGGGTLTLSGLTTAGFTGNYAINAGTLALDTSSNDLTITHDDLSGAVGTTLEKKGSGTLTLSGDSDTGDDFESAVNVTAGTLAFGAGDVLSNSAVVTLASGATLDLSTEGENFGTLTGTLTGSGSVTLGSEGIGLGGNNSDSTFSGNISGSGGSLTKFGSAMLTLSGTNTYTGGTFIEAGTLWVSGGNALADGGTVDLATNGATLDLSGSNETIGTLTGGGGDTGDVILGSGTLTVGNSSNFTFDGEIGVAADTGGLTKVGSGNFTLNGTARYSGATTIDGGTLTLGHATNTLRANSSISINNGATLAIGSNTDTVGAITLNSGSITGSTGVLTGSSYTVKSGTVSAQLGTGTLTKTTSGSVTLAGDNALTAVNIEAGTLAFGSGDILNDSAIVNLTGGTLDLSSGGEQIGNLTGTGGTVALGTNRLTVGLNDLPSTFTGGLSGSGVLRKDGTSTFTLGTGGITSFTGSIDLATNGLALSGPNGANDVFGGTLTGVGNLTKSGAGTVVLTGDNTYTGGTILHEGTLKVGSSGAINSAGVISFTGGTLQYGSANQTDYSGRFSQDANQAFSIDTNGQAVTFATSLISTGGTLTKKGSGTLTLATSNKHSGGTFLEGGTLIVGDNNALDDGSVTMAGGTTLSSNHNSRSIDNTIIVNGHVAFGGSDLELRGAVDLGGGTRSLSIDNNLTRVQGDISNGGLTKTGSGTLALEGNNTYTGGTVIAAGTLRVFSGNALMDTGSVTVQGGTLDLRNNETVGTVRLASGNITGSYTLTSNSAFDVESGHIAANLAGNAALTKTTTGVVTLSGTNNTYAGDTLVQAGVLRLGAVGALSPNTTLNVSPGARFEANGHAAAFAQLNGTGDIDVGTGGLTVSPSSGTNAFAGRLIGSGGLIKTGAGTLELSGTHTFTGATRIDAGRLRLNGSAAGSAFRVNDGGILSGSGTLGSLTIASGGTLAPGNSPGTLNAGNTVWESGGNFDFEIDNATGSSGSNWDLLAISGTLTINALAANPFTVDIDTLLSGQDTAGAMANFDANRSQEWIFVTTTEGITFGEGASIGASFAIEASGFANATNGSFSVSQIGNHLALTYTTSAVPEPGAFALCAGLCGLTLAATRRRRRA